MSTPRTDAFYTGPCKRVQTIRQRTFARRLEGDIEECRDTLKSVQDYLERGMCSCAVHGPHAQTCRRCDLLDDVKTALANTAP